MLQVPSFYHNTSRKVVDTFGNMFNDIAIQRFNSNNSVVENIPVPISYGGKSKYKVMNAKFTKEDQKFQMLLPQMTFEITGIEFDVGRKVNPINKNIYAQQQEQIFNTQFAPVPVNYTFNLYIMTKTTDDAFQIIESIIPFFHPNFANSLKLFPEMGLNLECMTTMDPGIQIDDTYTGDSDSTRYLIHTLGFQTRAWMAGPVNKSGLIKRVQVDFHVTDDVNDPLSPRQERIVVQPGLTANGQPTTIITESIPYTDINPTDPYGFITEIYHFEDGKTFDPNILEDVLPEDYK